nr:CPBP family intramembrane glutamic endopeptidase [Rhodococcus sp. (in: high G+C Gram-positive bacteria)]
MTPSFPGQPPPDPAARPPSWAGMAPMNAVHNVDSGLSDAYWRAEDASNKRRERQKWGIPAAAAVLTLNLAGFLTLPLVVSTDTSWVYVLAIMIPSIVAASVAFGISKYRGNGPVVDFGFPTSWSEFGGDVRTGFAWGTAALAGGIVLALVVLAQTDLADQAPLGGLLGIEMPWKVVLAAWVWLGAPFCEEVMFRGMLWGALERRASGPRSGAQGSSPQSSFWSTASGLLGNRWVILIVTAVLFALWHREGWRFVVLLWGGLAIGVARMRSGSVAASATAHSVNNTLPALAILLVA